MILAILVLYYEQRITRIEKTNGANSIIKRKEKIRLEIDTIPISLHGGVVGGWEAMVIGSGIMGRMR